MNKRTARLLKKLIKNWKFNAECETKDCDSVCKLMAQKRRHIARIYNECADDLESLIIAESEKGATT